jgi:hypothetical protein
MNKLVFSALLLAGGILAAQQSVPEQPVPPPGPLPTQPGAQPPAPAPLPPLVAVKAIRPPSKPLPSEKDSAGITQFSFIAYGDTRSGAVPDVPGDGVIIHPQHKQLVEEMIAKAKGLSATPFPVRFIVQSGDAVLRGINGTMWNVSFSPIIEKLSAANLPYFFSVGNHDVTGMPVGDRTRAQGLHNTLAAMSKLMPPEGSPRRLSGYPTYTFGYGNTFFVMIDSNIANDPLQLTWVTNQLEQLDRRRYVNIVAVFHHPPFSSGPHGGDTVEPATAVIRNVYMPLFRKHHVRLLITGHDHLLDHFVEHYTDPGGTTYRLDSIVTGGGGAPIYTYDSEPNLIMYLTAGAAQKIRVDHIMRPGPTQAENPHHFVVVRVDGTKLSVEVVALGGQPFAPYGGKPTIELAD